MEDKGTLFIMIQHKPSQTLSARTSSAEVNSESQQRTPRGDWATPQILNFAPASIRLILQPQNLRAEHRRTIDLIEEGMASLRTSCDTLSSA